jgi:hypothetical protein
MLEIQHTSLHRQKVRGQHMTTRFWLRGDCFLVLVAVLSAGGGRVFPTGNRPTVGVFPEVEREPSSPSFTPGALEGMWIGGHVSDEGYTWIRLNIRPDSANASRHIAIVDVPFQFNNGMRSPIAKGQHIMWETEDGSRQYLPLITRYVPGYFDGMLRWILQRSRAPT